MRSRFDMRWAGLLFGVLAVAIGGCGTMSGGTPSPSALLASPTLPLAPVAPPSVESVVTPIAEPIATAVAAETRGDTGTGVTPTAESLATPASAPPFVPVAFEPLSPEQSQSSMVAYAGALIAQSSSPRSASPAPDVEPQEYDPWEPLNEKVFAFNYNLDRYLVKPVAKVYNAVMPDELQRMISNGFDNINPVPQWVNNLLQGNVKGFATELGRFLINSTLGIGGLWDIAKQEFGLQKTKVDFGQTLGKWGVEPGPYLILPLLSPLTVRDGIGYGVDGAMNPLSYFIPFIWDKLGMRIGETVNDRSLNLDLYQGFEESTVDLYSAVRNGYLQRRYNLIHRER